MARLVTLQFFPRQITTMVDQTTGGRARQIGEPCSFAKYVLAQYPGATNKGSHASLRIIVLWDPTATLLLDSFHLNASLPRIVHSSRQLNEILQQFIFFCKSSRMPSRPVTNFLNFELVEFPSAILTRMSGRTLLYIRSVPSPSCWLLLEDLVLLCIVQQEEPEEERFDNIGGLGALI